MNIKTEFTKTLTVAAVAAAGLGVSAVTANGATDYWLAGDDGYESSSLNMTGSQIGGWATAQGGAKTSHVPAAGNVYHVGCSSNGSGLLLRTPNWSSSCDFPGEMVMEGGRLCFKGADNGAVTIATLTCKGPYSSTLNNSNTSGNGTFNGSSWTVEEGAVMYASENAAATIGITFSTKIVGAGTLKAENLNAAAAAKATVTYDGDLSEFVGRVEAVNAAGGAGQLTMRFTQGSALTAGPANLDAESVVVRNHAALSFGETLSTHPNRGFQIDGAVINVDAGKVVSIYGPVVAPNGFTKTGGGTLQISDSASIAKDKVVVQDGKVYTLEVNATLTGSTAYYDGHPHTCSLVVAAPFDAATVKWAWHDDLESFTHDEPEPLTESGVYKNACRVTKEGYGPFEGIATVTINPVLYVATDGSDDATGKPNAPLKTIAEAVKRIGTTLPGRIFVNDGTYMLEKKFDTYPYTATVNYTCGWCVQVCAPIEIIGLSHDPNKVILDAKDARCALMVLNHPDASIRYLTLQNAYADEKGPAGSYGGGNLRLDAGTVSDCIFRNGKAKGHAGNLWVSAGAGLVSRCAFYGGVCIEGQGGTSSVFAIGDAANDKRPTVENCFIYSGGVGEGRTGANLQAVTARNGAKFVNCTIAGSGADQGAANIYDGHSYFMNCAIYDNGGKDYTGNSFINFMNCAAATECPGGRDCEVVDEPKFKNTEKFDYRLKSGSPLVGTGNLGLYQRYAMSETDLAGNKRIRKDAISIGCYEYVQNGIIITFW